MLTAKIFPEALANVSAFVKVLAKVSTFANAQKLAKTLAKPVATVRAKSLAKAWAMSTTTQRAVSYPIGEVTPTLSTDGKLMVV